MNDTRTLLPGEACALPILDHPQIVLGHGSGGKLTADLIQKVFLPAFTNPYLARLDDQAVLQAERGRWAFTRLVRGHPHFLPRRRYRATGDQRHGE